MGEGPLISSKYEKPNIKNPIKKADKYKIKYKKSTKTFKKHIDMINS